MLGSVVLLLRRANATPPVPPLSSPLGIVVSAHDSQTRLDTAYTGATVYDGDKFNTQDGGTMRMRLGSGQLLLFPSTSVRIHSLPGGFSADLSSGIVSISSPEGHTFKVIVNEITMQPANSNPTVAQVQRISSTEAILIEVRRDLKVTLGDEVRTVTAGNSYKVEVAHPDNSQQQSAQPSGRNRNRLLIVVITALAAGTSIGIWRAVLSPTVP
jgi:hypothetical protein